VHTYEWAAANEPPLGTTATACFLPYYKMADVVAGAPRSARIIALALHAAVDLTGDDEVTAHYSPNKEDAYAPERAAAGYEAGKPATLLRRDIPPDELPAAHFGTSAPLEAMW